LKNIIIISSVFYPRNSPRANRVTELAKEFSRQGHNVIVYANLGDYDYKKLEFEFSFKVKDIGKMRFVDITSDEIQRKPKLINILGTKLLNKIIQFPYIEYSYRVYKTLNNLEFKYDILISLAVPFPIHWGVAYAKNKVLNFPHTWIADCGDPFMGNPNVRYPFYFKYIEKWFCKKTDYLTVPTQESISAYYPEFHNKIKVIPQGFNFEEYNDLPKYKRNKIPTFIYAGAFYENIRDPRPFLKFLASLEKDFKFIIYTRNKKLIEDYKTQLGPKLEVKDYIPRKDVIKQFAKADFLINFENAKICHSFLKLK